MFMKLFATSIVANNFFGRSKSLEIIWIRLDFCSRPSSISVLVRENKATSAPDTRAEKNNNKNKSTKPVTIDGSIAKNNALKLGGPGSKYHNISYTIRMEGHHPLLQ